MNQATDAFFLFFIHKLYHNPKFKIKILLFYHYTLCIHVKDIPRVCSNVYPRLKSNKTINLSNRYTRIVRHGHGYAAAVTHPRHWTLDIQPVTLSISVTFFIFFYNNLTSFLLETVLTFFL